MIELCARCHRWVHENPRAARDAGWIISAYGLDPAQVPVLCKVRGLIMPNDDWTVTLAALSDMRCANY